MFKKKFLIILLIAVISLTACVPQVEALPTVTSLPETNTPQVEMTITEAPSPTATPTLIPPATLFEGRLLFSRFTEASETFTGMFVAQTDGSEVIAVPLPWEEGGGQWSESGTEIAVGTLLADGRIGTAIIATDGTVLRELSIPDATLNLPCLTWSRDDTRLACEAWDDTDPSRNGIYTVSASDGTDVQRLTTPPTGKHDLPGDYSPDGQFVFKRASDYEAPGPLMLVDANGGEPRIFYAGPVNDSGLFSPDGRFVLTVTNGTILVIGLDGKVVHTISIDGHIAFGPAWSPDGTRIAFSLTTPGVYRADIYTSLPDGTDLQQVTNTADNEIDVDWGVGG